MTATESVPAGTDGGRGQTGGVLSAILNWLRKGYPEGVPPKDYIPLVALLRHRLTDEELDSILSRLHDSGSLPVQREDIAAAVRQVLQAPPSDEDIAVVSARLAAAGWPLQARVSDPSPERRSLLASVVGWLRAGYPTGVPPQDYVPLFALLRRRLTDEEIGRIVDELTGGPNSPIARVDIGVMITRVTNEMPSETDVEQVQDRLRAVGWNVAPQR